VTTPEPWPARPRTAPPASRPVALAARGVVLAFLAVIPLRIVAQGYVPGDDVLRHVATAVSIHSWNEVLVLRPDVLMDSHPGWHAFLGAVHRATGAGTHGLLLLSIVACYLALILPAVFLMRRPEAWAIALFAFSTLDDAIPSRFASGRPFVLSMGALVVLCLLVARPGFVHRGWRAVVIIGAVLGVVIWIHPSWHLFLLPVGACLLARRWRAAGELFGGLMLGLLVAGILYGNPARFVYQSVLHTALALGGPAPPGTLVREFLPGAGSAPVVLGVLLLLLWRFARGAWSTAVVDNPVFLLAATGWMLGWVIVRFWQDWGVPALLVFVAIELEIVLERRVPADSTRRLLVAGVAGLGALLVLTANTRGQRFSPADRPYLSLTQAAGEAVPDPGGILYTDDMRLYYDLFYSLPDAPWRYLVGYEPALMPPDDLATFRRILTARTPGSFEPWVRKMRPPDRLILQSTQGRPQIEGLEWTQVSATIWSGRLLPATPAPRSR
jgi:hypothetical protein